MSRSNYRILTPTNGDGAPQADPAPEPSVEPLLWSLEQAAQALNHSARSLKRAVAEGRLPPGAVVRPLGRRRLFVRPILEKWIEAGCPPVSSGRQRRRV